MQKRQVLINAIFSTLQILVISVILFVLYRFLLNTLGVEQLGVWSLVLATTSVTQFANFGLSGSVVKFVAKYIARGEDKNVSKVIQTAVLSVALFVGIILIIGYPVAKFLLGLVISREFLPSAHAILPHTFLAFWFLMITSIFQAGLDGYQRIDLRSLLLMGGAAVHLLLCFILAPRYGLIGVAYARVIQNIMIFLSSWFLLKRFLVLIPIFYYRWDKGIFKEMIGYSISFQTISVTTMFYDPITKGLLSKFGGISMVGFYEMASRMVQQFRSLIVSAIQVLVPAIAELKEKTPEKINSVYLDSYQLLFYLALPLYTFVIVSTPIISELWIGHYERVFNIFATLLSIGWFLNTLNAPAYFVNLGIGELRWNVIGHITIGILNAGLGVFLGAFYDGIGVVIAWACSLALGSSMIYIAYHFKHGVPIIELLPKTSRILAITCSIFIIIALIATYKLNSGLDSVALNSIIVFSFVMIVFIPLWIHPIRKTFKGWVMNKLLNTKQEN
jgi:O-antigen/teichoic acid export membrane protein